MPLFCKTGVFNTFFCKDNFSLHKLCILPKTRFYFTKNNSSKVFWEKKIKKKMGKNTFSLVATPQGEFSPHTYIQLKVEVLAILLHYSCFSLCQLVISVFCSCHLYLSITNKCFSHIYCKYVHTVV